MKMIGEKNVTKKTNETIKYFWQPTAEMLIKKKREKFFKP